MFCTTPSSLNGSSRRSASSSVAAPQENRAAARALPASQYGQSRGPSRCVGISRRAVGSGHALVRWPARDSAAITCRHACRDHGGYGRRATASRVFSFRSDCAGGYALIDGCNTKSHRHSRWLAIRLWLFLLNGRVLDSFSRHPHISTRLVHIIACSRQVPPRRLNQSAPEILSISSEGLYLHCQYKNSLLGPTGLQQCVGSLFRENAHHQLWFFSFVRRTERLHLPLPRSEPCRMAEIQT